MISPGLPDIFSAGRETARLLVAPTDLRATDPMEGEDLLSDRFCFQGETLETNGKPPFSCAMPDDAFLREMARFSWLRHFRTQDSSAANEKARASVLSFLRRHRRISGPCWQTDVASQRLLAWLSHSTVVLKGADTQFYRRFAEAILRHERILRQRYKTMPDDENRLTAAIALCMVSICMDMPEKRRRQASRRLDAALDRQVLPDGGHITRNPQTLLNVLFSLLPLRQTYINLDLTLPKRLVPAIDRIYPALRFFRHADGNLALFNGNGATLATDLSAIMRYDETGGTAFKALPHTGYHRLQGNGTVLITDAGKPFSPHLSKTAHAGALSFEMSSGRSRFIVNAGVPNSSDAEMLRMARSTAAHSAVTLGETASVRFSHSAFLGPVAIGGIRNTGAERSTGDDGTDTVDLWHDGYLGTFGVYCLRRISLSPDGQVIAGSDRFDRKNGEAPGPENRTAAIVRFHLHPSVWALRENEHSIFLTAPDNESWLFSAPGLQVEIEEDLFFASNAGLTRSQQITVSSVIGDQSQIDWRFERQS